MPLLKVCPLFPQTAGTPLFTRHSSIPPAGYGKVTCDWDCTSNLGKVGSGKSELLKYKAEKRDSLGRWQPLRPGKSLLCLDSDLRKAQRTGPVPSTCPGTPTAHNPRRLYLYSGEGSDSGPGGR